MTTVSIHMPEQTGQTGQTIELRKTSDGTLLNTDGDALTESPSGSGRFTADVAESWSETLAAVVKSGGLSVRDGWLPVGGTIVVDAYVAAIAADAVTTIQSGLARTGADGDTLETLSDQIDGISGGGSGLTGPYTRTVTVTDSVSSAAIQGAKVRLYRTGETGTESTNVSGVATFTVEAATWSYAITANGYTGQSGTIVVSANGDTAISLVASVVTAPDDPALCAVTMHLRDQYGADLPYEPVEFTWVQWSGSTETPPVLTVPPVQATDATGIVEVNLYRNAVYKIVYGNAPYTRRVDKTIPDAGSYEVEL